MLSPYQNSLKNWAGSMHVGIFVKKEGSKFSKRVFLDDEQFLEFVEFITEMFPPKKEDECVDFNVEDCEYKIEKIKNEN